MHFFYLDETGCTAADLNAAQQPIFVLGGLSVDAKRWRKTTELFEKLISDFSLANNINIDELHASELLNSKGKYQNISREKINKFISDCLSIIVSQKHPIHFVAIDKKRLGLASRGDPKILNTNIPYLLAFNYLVGYVEKYTKECLGSTARAMMIIDEKEIFLSQISEIVNFKRNNPVKTRRLKWLVELTYAVDSKRNPMIQLSDLVIFLVRKFIELDSGYRDNWPIEAKSFYKQCYEIIIDRVNWKTQQIFEGKEALRDNELLKACFATHSRNFKKTKY